MEYTTKQCDQLARTLHEANNSIDIFEAIVCNNIDKLLETKHNGIVSKLIEYYIHNNNDNMISHIVTYMENIDNFQLMKRDYLHIIKYYYNDNIILACDIFQHKVLNNEFLMKDIDYIVDNNMNQLLIYLDGLFIKTSYSNNMVKPIINNSMKLYTISDAKIDNILKYINHNINMNMLSSAIIDGGSVIHNRNGMITKHSIGDLINIITKVRKEIGEPLLVIHKRHMKTIPNLVSMLEENKVNYYMTPPNINDDMFILYFFLKLRTKPFIITNDKYRDHIFSFEKSKEKIIGMSQFKDVIEQQTLDFNCMTDYIKTKPTFSNCIQVIDNNIYIPHKDGDFVCL